MVKQLLAVSLFVAACQAQDPASQKAVYKLLYSPPSQVPGAEPTSMFEVSPGVFYVLSVATESNFGASIVSVTSAGTFKVFYSLQPNYKSYALVQSANGKLYAPGFSTQSNFYFSLTPSGKNYQQYPFPGTWGSAWQTIVTPPGPLYDIVAMDVASNIVWGFARIDEDGKMTVLHQFSGSEGLPVGTDMAYGPDGNIYAVGSQTRYAGPGFIYRLTPTGAYSQLLTFPSFPVAGHTLPLVVGSDGNLYGTFAGGGTNGTGEIYQAPFSGQLQTVANFPANSMGKPETLLQAADGNIYGTTLDNFIFRYNLATHTLQAVYHLSSNLSQGKCGCQLVEGMDGRIYGVTPLGGNPPGIGAVFSLDIGLPKPLPLVAQLSPSSGPVGQSVLLWGNYLLGATSVTFNGVPATTLSVTSVNSAYATVPAGATSGPVTITTANGSVTTTGSFTVQ